MNLQQLSTCFLDKDLQFGTSVNKLSVVWVIYRQRSLLLSIKQTVEDTKGQIYNGSISQYTLHGR